MEWEKFALNFGLPGLMLVAMAAVIRLWVASNERIEMRRLQVEDKKADGIISGFLALGAKVDAHHNTDIQSHRDLGESVARIDEKLDTFAGIDTGRGRR